MGTNLRGVNFLIEFTAHSHCSGLRESKRKRIASFSAVSFTVNKNTTKGNSVRASAPPQIAEDGIRPRLYVTRLRLVVPIGVIIAVAIICIIVAVLSAARRADEVSLNREQQLIRQAVSDRAARVLQEVDSVAETQDATEAIRREYDPQWVERRAGYWLETFFDDDMVVVVDASDRGRI